MRVFIKNGASKSAVVSEIKNFLVEKMTVEPEHVKKFFKTGAGHYAADDIFIGVRVPDLRIIAKNFKLLKLNDIQHLIESKINEERMLALIILTHQYQAGDKLRKAEIYQFYLNNIKYVNNWNLVDCSAHLIIGDYLLDKDRKLLLSLAKSASLWERRIAIVSTWYFIRNNDLEWTFKIARMLMADKQDLIHKATGWMLREAGKRNQTMLVNFLNDHAAAMPRTMLRYAIEKFSQEQRKIYLLKKSYGH